MYIYSLIFISAQSLQPTQFQQLLGYVGKNISTETNGHTKMLVMLVDPGGFPLRTWVMLSGHLVLPEGWHGVSRDLQQWSFAEDPERGK